MCQRYAVIISKFLLLVFLALIVRTGHLMDEILSQKGFNIFHLNIRSLTPKLDQLRILLENNNVDIFSISETWLHAGISCSILSIPGYAFARYDRETTIQEHNCEKRWRFRSIS